jgi:hypothetical protein
VDFFGWCWRLLRLGIGGGLRFAEGDAGCGVKEAADGPGRIFARQKDLTRALLLRAVVPAAEEREVIGEGGEVKG